jgi:hypothetical protein
MEHGMHPHSGGRAWSALALAEAVDELSDEERDYFLCLLFRQGPSLEELLRAEEGVLLDKWVVVPTEVFSQIRKVIMKMNAQQRENVETAVKVVLQIAEKAADSQKTLAQYQRGPAARRARTLERDRLIDQLIEKEGFDPDRPSKILDELQRRNADCVKGVEKAGVMMRHYQVRKRRRSSGNG